MDFRTFMSTSRARNHLDLEREARAAAANAAAGPSCAAQTGGLRRATLTRRPHAGLPELGQARSGRMPDAQFASDGPRSRPSKTRPSWEQLLASSAKRGVRRFGYPDSRTCGNRPGLRFGGCRPCPEITASDCG